MWEPRRVVPLFRRRGKVVFRVVFLLFSSVSFSNAVSFFVVSLHVYDVYERRQASDSAFLREPCGSAHCEDREQWRTDNPGSEGGWRADIT